MARGRFIDRSRYAYPTTFRDAQRKQQQQQQETALAAAGTGAGAATSFDPSLADQPGLDPREEVLSEAVASAVGEHATAGMAGGVDEISQVVEYSIDDLIDPVDPNNDRPLPGEYAQRMTDQWYEQHPELDPAQQQSQPAQSSNDQYGA